MESELAEWYQGQAVFFDKTHPDHADKPKKDRKICIVHPEGVTDALGTFSCCQEPQCSSQSEM